MDERVWFPPGFDPGRLALKRHRPGRSDVHHVDLLLAELSARQHGTVARRQLLALGIRPGEIEARLRSGALLTVRRSVYAVGRPAVGPPAWRMAAVLAAGHDARLAGWAGATQRELLPERGGRVDVAIPPRRRVVLPGLVVHRTLAVPEDWDLAGGIPTHSVARILLDLAIGHDPPTVEWAWRQAIYRRVLDVQQVTALLARQAGCAGTPVVRALVERRAELVGDLRSRFEVLMLGIIREAGLPEPLVNQPLVVGGGLTLRPDFRIPALMLVLESDGRDGHADVEFLLTDDERDAHYAALGYRTLRHGYWEAKRERGRVIDGLRAAAAAQRSILVLGEGRSSAERRA